MNMTAAIGVLCWMAASAYGESVAIVKKVEGKVLAQRGGVTHSVKKGEFVQETEILHTFEKSSVGLIFNDGTLVSLGPKSILSLNRYRFDPAENGYEWDMTLKRGSAAVESGKIGKLSPESVRFRVPQGIVGIRGTRFIVEVEE